MQTVKLVLNALVVGALNLTSFVIGFWIFKLSVSGEQRLVQGTAAMLVAVALVVVWLVVFRKVNRLEIEYDFIKVFLLTFLLTPVIFVPAHFVVTGYLTSIGNILAIAAYQFPMNVLALAISAGILNRMKKAPRGGFPPNSTDTNP